jgi:hypothetical protein
VLRPMDQSSPRRVLTGLALQPIDRAEHPMSNPGDQRQGNGMGDIGAGDPCKGKPRVKQDEKCDADGAGANRGDRVISPPGPGRFRYRRHFISWATEPYWLKGVG